jgi:iron(III) transport system permease protein
MSSAAFSLDRIRASFRFEPSSLVLTAVLVCLTTLVLSPIYLLLVSSLQSDATGTSYCFACWFDAFDEPGISAALANTLIITGSVQVISIPIAIVIAWVIARSDMPGAHLAEILFWVTFFIPNLAVTAGWILIWDPQFGLGNQVLIGSGLFTKSPANIYSVGGIVFTHLTSLSISTKVMMMAAAFRNMDASLEEAARMSGAGAAGVGRIGDGSGVVYNSSRCVRRGCWCAPFHAWIGKDAGWSQRVSFSPAGTGWKTSLAAAV